MYSKYICYKIIDQKPFMNSPHSLVYFHFILIRTLYKLVEWNNIFLYKIFINKIKSRHLLLSSSALIVIHISNWYVFCIFFPLQFNLCIFFLHLGPSLKFVSYCSPDLTNVLISPLLSRTRWVHKSPASPRVNVCARGWIYESGLQDKL